MSAARFALAAGIGVAAAALGALALAMDDAEHAQHGDAAHGLGHQALVGVTAALLAGLLLSAGEKRRIAPLALAAGAAWLAAALALLPLTP